MFGESTAQYFEVFPRPPHPIEKGKGGRGKFRRQGLAILGMNISHILWGDKAYSIECLLSPSMNICPMASPRYYSGALLTPLVHLGAVT